MTDGTANRVDPVIADETDPSTAGFAQPQRGAVQDQAISETPRPRLIAH